MRLLRWIGRVVLVLVLLVVGAVGVVVWRVRSGPVPLDFLVPRLKAALAKDEGWRIDVEGLELVWEAAARQVELRARGLHIARPNEGASVALAGARIRLKRRALLRGEVVVVSIELDAPTLQLVRDVNGQFAMQLDSPAAEARDLGWLWSMMRTLQHVAVRNGRIAFTDEATGTRWDVPDVDADVWRAGGPLRVQIGLTLAAGGAALPLWVDAFYRFEAGTLELQMSSPGAATSVVFAAWPPSVAKAAHDWVTRHVKDGRIGASVLAVTGHVIRGETRKLALDDIDASVAFDGLSVRYLDTMPPVVGVGGVAHFTRENVDVAVTTGKLDALAVGPARVRVAWPAGGRDRIAIDAQCRGPLASLIGVLDHDPVALGQRVSFQTRGIAGATVSRVRLAFPLAGPHKLGTLGLRATTTITDASVPYIAGEWELTRGHATVAVNHRTMSAEGTAALRGIPVSFTFKDRFAKPTAQRRVIAARLDAPERRALGIDVGTSVTGPVDVRVRFAPKADGRLVADVEADLAPATVAIPALAIGKAPGEPGRAVARLAIGRGDVVSAVERFHVAVGAVTLRGDAARSPTGGAWDRVDAAVTFALPDRRDDPPRMLLALRAQDERWRTELTTSDVGLVLRAYGNDGVRGGTLTLDGLVDLRAEGAPFEGRLTIENVTLSRVPWLVKVVSLASIRGLLDLGSEPSLFVDRAVATVTHRPPSTIEIRDAVARGPQIGLDLAGTVDHATDTIDVTGTIVPSYYFLNEGVDRLPVIGQIIGRATGGAVQAVTFTVRGPRADPVVAVQPLSSLAPGVLRDWLRKLGW